MNPQEVIDFVGSAKALLPTLKADSEGQKAAIADLTQKFQKLQEDSHKPQIMAPTGESARKFVCDNGQVRFVSGVETRTFAGMTVRADMEGLLDSAPVSPWHQELLALMAGRKIVRSIFGTSPSTDAKILGHMAKAPQEIRGALEATVKRAISDTSGSGAEWLPDVMSSRLYEEFYTAPGIADLFETVEMASAAAGMIIPTISDTVRPYLKGKISNDDPTKYTGSTPGSSNQTMEAVGFAVRVLIDDSAVEDSVFPLLPQIQKRVGRALMDGYEDAMINGDTTATHEDAIASWNIRGRWGATGLGGSADHRRSFKGLRRIAVDRSLTVDQSAGQTVAKVMEQILGGLGERGTMDAVILVSPEVFFQKMLTDTNVLTVDKLGQLATILTGQLAQISGVPVVMTRWLSADLAASGLYTGTGAKSGVIGVSRTEFMHFNKRSTMVEIMKDITVGGYNVVATRRSKFATLSGSTSQVVKYGYNWL